MAFRRYDPRRMRAERRFSQAIAEGDGISLVAHVSDAGEARTAEQHGAEGLSVDGAFPGLRETTRLPILWRGSGPLTEAASTGADACVLVVAADGDEPGRLEQLEAEARDLGLECALEVRSDDELRLVLERLDPEIFVLSPRGDPEASLEAVLTLLSDVPAGKLAVAEVTALERDQLQALERAGVDGVILPEAAIGGLAS